MTRKILTANHSHFPKIGDGPGEQQLRQACHRLDRGELDEKGLREIERRVTAEVISLQEACGLDVVTDGQIRWVDPISHPTRALDNVRISGLLRYFDTNFYFREPHVSGPVRFKKPQLKEDAEFLDKTARQTSKAVVTGPYTLACHSKIQGGAYDSLASLVEDYAEAVAEEVLAIVRAGVKRVQIEEPSLVRNPADAELVRQALTGLVRRDEGVTVELALYFGDATPLLGPLAEFPVDSVTFDLIYGPRIGEELAEKGFPLGVGLGLLDGRNTRLEDLDGLKSLVGRVASKVDGDLVLTTSCGLEYLPRDKALAKLKALVKLKSRL